MSLSKTYKQLRYVYIENNPMQYPPLDIGTAETYKENNPRHTGWQLLPNCLIGHMLSPAQWWDVTRTFDAIRVDAVTGTVFNMIPLTETMAIQGNTTFTAFNNTLYALGYADNKYETMLYDWSLAYDNFTLYQKEGMESQIRGNSARMNLPEYDHYLFAHPEYPDSWPSGGTPSTGQAFPQMAGTLWDPLNCPDDLLELRPGKNAIKFTWTRHESDTKELYALNTDVYLNQLNKRATILNAYKLVRGYFQQFNWAITPLVDNWAYNDTLWSNLQAATWKHDDSNEKRICNVFPPFGQFNAKFPIPNWFIKLIPLYNSENTLIKTSAQVAYLTEVTVVGAPRKEGAHFAPSIDNGCGGVNTFYASDVATTMSWNTSVYGTGKSSFYGIPSVIPHSASYRPRFAIDTGTNIYNTNGVPGTVGMSCIDGAARGEK